MIVALEGIDACGKATHSKLLAKTLNAACFSFPNYETPSGKIIRKMLQEHAWMVPAMHHAETFQALQVVNRMEHMGLINSLRKIGKSIVFDRYDASAFVYGGKDGIGEDWLRLINEPLGCVDHRVLIDIPVELSFTRRPKRRDKIEADAAYLRDIRDRYLRLFSRMRKLHYHGDQPRLSPWHVVDGQGTVAEVQQRICDAIGV